MSMFSSDSFASSHASCSDSVFAEITIVGGAYHEVRRIFAALGSHVLGLCRVGFGRLTLPRDLAPGAYRSVVRLPRELFGETEVDLNVSLIAEVNQVVDYSALLAIEIRFAGHAGNMRGNALLRPQLEWRTEALAERAPTTSST